MLALKVTEDSSANDIWRVARSLLQLEINERLVPSHGSTGPEKSRVSARGCDVTRMTNCDSA